jgi:hypothetical protein
MRPRWLPALPDPWEYWKKGAIDSLGPLFRRRHGTGSGGGDDDDKCGARHGEERQRCFDRRPDMAHPDYFFGCLDRAKERWLRCQKNGYPGGPGEVPEWGDDDEETWRNFDR